MNHVKELQSLPNVEPIWEIEEILKDPIEYVRSKKALFTNTYEALACYQIPKGTHKGEFVILYMDACIDGTTEQYTPYYGIKTTGCDGDDGTFDSLEKTIKKLKRIIWEHELRPVYRVYEAKLKDEDETIQFSISEVRETSFREEVKNGKFLIELDSMKLIKETEDRNEAKNMATEF